MVIVNVLDTWPMTSLTRVGMEKVSVIYVDSMVIKLRSVLPDNLEDHVHSSEVWLPRDHRSNRRGGNHNKAIHFSCNR